MRLNRKVDPIGTRHQIPTMTPAGITSPVYKVNRILGDRTFVPSSEIMVELAFAWQRSTHHFAPFITISLQTLASDGVPVSESDVFWIAEKTDE